MARWDYRKDGGVYSDVQDDTILRMLARRELTADDEVAYSGTGQWTRVRQVPAFAEQAAKAERGPTAEAITRLPGVNTGTGMRFYFIWFLITIGTSSYAWHLASNYNPEGNGMYNLIEASILNQAWLQVAAALLSAIFSSLFFAAALIASRLRNIAEINRAGHLAILEELRRPR